MESGRELRREVLGSRTLSVLQRGHEGGFGILTTPDPGAAMEQLVILATSRIEWIDTVGVVVRIGVAERELRSEVVVVLARDEVVRTAQAMASEMETVTGNESEPLSVLEDDEISYCASVVQKHG